MSNVYITLNQALICLNELINICICLYCVFLCFSTIIDQVSDLNDGASVTFSSNVGSRAYYIICECDFNVYVHITNLSEMYLLSALLFVKMFTTG